MARIVPFSLGISLLFAITESLPSEDSSESPDSPDSSESPDSPDSSESPDSPESPSSSVTNDPGSSARRARVISRESEASAKVKTILF